MFIRSELQGLVDEVLSLPHDVSVAAPFTFDIRPHGLEGSPAYRVLVERSAFQMRAAVVPDYLAVAVVAAVVAGATNR